MTKERMEKLRAKREIPKVKPLSILDKEYLECVSDYIIVDRDIGLNLFYTVTKDIKFHAGGRLSVVENENCQLYSSIEELKKYLFSQNILNTEEIIIVGFHADTPIIKTKLKNFYDCFSDCLDACSDVWLIFENLNFFIECNHDDEIIVCNS